MNKKQEARLNMRRAVAGHCNANPAIIAAVPVFAAKSGELNALIAEIFDTSQSQESAITGFAAGKNISKKDLCETAENIAKPIRAYAKETGNETLRAEVDYSYSDLFRKRDDQVAQHCQLVHDKGAANLDALKDYGTTQGKLDTLQSAIDNYTARITAPRTARAERSLKTGNLEDLFTESREVLESMDDLIDNFEVDNPDFVKTYRLLREIDAPKTTGKLDGGGENPPA